MANKKNDFYWNNYISAADTACCAADYLLKCLREFDPERLTEVLPEMHIFEHKGDSLRHEMTEALAKSFVTPSDREDMAELCQRLDHVIDSIEEVLQAIYINNVAKITGEAIRFSELICNCTAKMKAMLTELPNFRKSEQLHKLIIDVNTAEEECDVLYLQSAYSCRKNWDGKNPLDVIAWREIYSALEECADACEDVADTVEAVVMKNT
jgi:predicted phosphate transport protein (TIGR00153 family)